MSPKRYHDLCMKRHYGRDRGKLFSATLLSGCIVGIELILSIFLVVYWTLEVDQIPRVVFTGILVANLVLLLWAFVELMRGRDVIARHVLMVTTLVSVFVSVGLTGGFPHSVATPCLVLVPLVAFTLYGPKIGLRFTFLLPPLVFGQWIATTLIGVSLPNLTSTSTMALSQMMAWVVSYSITLYLGANYQRQAFRLRRELFIEKRKFAELATTDCLTSLCNARRFNQEFDAALATALPDAKPLFLLYIDLNGFKLINDQYGHQAGDHVLLTVAQRLCRCVRDTDIVARLGGDEFAILLTKDIHVSEADKIIARIHKSINQPIGYRGTSLQVTTSLGMASYPDDGSDRVELIIAADDSMYQNKADGRNGQSHYAADFFV